MRPELVTEPKPIYAEVLAPADRDDRAGLIATASRYFDAIARNTSDVPFHPSCNRTANDRGHDGQRPARGVVGLGT